MTPPNPTLILSEAAALATPSLVLGPLVAMLNDPDRSFGRIADLIQTDAALSAELLRIANSSAYARSGGGPSSIGAAVSLLGERLILETVTKQIGQVMGADEVSGYDILNQGLWRHSLRMAIASKLVAKVLPTDVKPGEAYTIALLCDLGKLVLGPHLTPHQSAIMAMLQEDETMGFNDAEVLTCGVDHACVSATIATAWGLPTVLAESLRYHHRPSDAADPAHRERALIVHLGDAIATISSYSKGMDAQRYQIDPLGTDAFSEHRALLEPLLGQTEVEALTLEASLASG